MTSRLITSPGIDHVIGVDLGGTKILAGVFDRAHRCLGRARMKTKGERGPEIVVERLARCVREAAEDAAVDLDQIGAVGVGAPGVVEADTGRVIAAPNLGWTDFPLQDALGKSLGRPVVVGNDGNLCALGVHTVELDRGPRFMVGIFLGTGIGCGLVFEGRLFDGCRGAAGEIGHVVLKVGGPPCGCGNLGCFEALASRTALTRQVQEALKDGETTLLTDMLGSELEDLRSGDFRKALEQGDGLVTRLINEAARYTGLAVGSVINLLNPDCVVLGGGLIQQLERHMMPVVVETALRQAMPGTSADVTIRASKLADDAGIVGGAVLAWRTVEGAESRLRRGELPGLSPGLSAAARGL